MPKTAAAKSTSQAATPGVDQTAREPGPAGSVSFVGTGPGDPGLLTIRAVELIRAAEIVIIESPDHVTLLQTILGADAGRLTVVDGGYGEDGQPLTHA
ncbi:MAG: bifunctional uroporphyrinogen-III C-methyltransferase/uroporphyrinogen-III synthase, partial [Propionibacteriales bacterium]|nr:bifunctional uroporphyrinogen-III C-methyltransferase/uroporphyrinogen-III synthase [Propionibacteriales bacterium]